MNRMITRQELQEKMERNEAMVLVEALPESSYQKGHLPGAIHLPHDRVRELAPKLLPDRNIPVVTYCASATCQNSHIAAETLRALGYTNVSVYAGGKQDWSEAGLALQPATTRAA